MSVVETPSKLAVDSFTIRWVGYGLVVLGTALPIFIMFADQGAAQALTLASIVVQVGLLALIERVPQAFMVTSRRSSQQAINFVLVIPVVALAVAGSNARFVHPEIAGLIAAAAAAVGMLVAVWLPRPVAIASPILFGVLVGCYAGGFGWGSLTLVNRVFDPSPPQVFAAMVEAKRMSYGGRGGPHYYVTMGPWGPVDHTVTTDVGGRIYSQVYEGGQICARLHPGALGAAWYYIGVC